MHHLWLGMTACKDGGEAVLAICPTLLGRNGGKTVKIYRTVLTLLSVMPDTLGNVWAIRHSCDILAQAGPGAGRPFFFTFGPGMPPGRG